MDNTSATGGYLRASGAILTREALEDVWHDIVVGICGLDPTLVRPEYQVNPPAIPPVSTDWAALRVIQGSAINFPEVRHQPEGEGQDAVVDHVRWTVTVFFYGPLADDLAGELRRGLQIEQNRLALRRANIALVAVEAPVSVPQLDDQIWRRRADLEIETIVRTVSKYRVLNLLSSSGTVGAGNFDTERV